MNFSNNGFMSRPPPNYNSSTVQSRSTYEHHSNYEQQSNYEPPSKDGGNSLGTLRQQLMQLSNSLVGQNTDDDGWTDTFPHQGNFQTSRNQNATGSSNDSWNKIRSQNSFASTDTNKAGHFNNYRQQWPAAIPSTSNDAFPTTPSPTKYDFNNRGGPYNKNGLGSNRGANLLKKMGWQPGEGLGKDQSGPVQHIMMPGQTGLNKRGFSSKDEWIKPRKQLSKKKKPQQKQPKVKALKVEGKHPISVLCEYAMRNKYHLPQYIIKSESGEPHLKTFIFSVKLNDVEFIMPNNTEHHVKKKAKEIITRYCLDKLGIKMPK